MLNLDPVYFWPSVVILVMNSDRTIKILLYLDKMYLVECMCMYKAALVNGMQFLHDLIYSGKLGIRILCVLGGVCVCVPVNRALDYKTENFIFTCSYYLDFLLLGFKTLP
jgi:hypothetical protein